MDAPGQKKIEPQNARIMWLDREGGRKTQGTNRQMPLVQEAPDPDYAEADNDSRRVARGKEYFAVEKQDADEHQGNARRGSGAKAPHERCRQYNSAYKKDDPKRVRRTPGKQCKGSDEQKGCRQIHIQSDRFSTLDGVRGKLLALNLIVLNKLVLVIWIAMMQETPGAVIDALKADYAARDSATYTESPEERDSSAEDKQQRTYSPHL